MTDPMQDGDRPVIPPGLDPEDRDVPTQLNPDHADPGYGWPDDDYDHGDQA